MKKIVIISLMLLAGMAAKSQYVYYKYTYDNGNRVKREKFTSTVPPQSPPAPPKNDTIITADTVNAEIIIPHNPQSNADSTKIADSENGKAFESALGERKISIYPNPTKGELRVDITNFNPESKGIIYIVDMSGKVVYQNTNISASNIIDISSTARTTYVLRIVIDGKAKEWIIVKQ